MSEKSDSNCRSTDILNGARCGPYSWSQSREDLQVRVKVRRNNIKYEQVNVKIGKQNIKVELNLWDGTTGTRYKEVLADGRLEHPIDQESACWLLDNEHEPAIVIYVDKSEELWWKQLFLNEQTIEVGPKNRTILMDHLDDGSRMMIDKLIVDQRNKLMRSNESS